MSQNLFLNYYAGEDITRGNVLYLDSSLTVKKAKADSTDTYPAMGMALESGSTGDTIAVLASGMFENFSHGFSDGSLLYLSDSTAGNLIESTPDIPNIAQQVGQVVSSDTIIFGTVGFIDVNRFSIVGSATSLTEFFPVYPNTVAFSDGGNNDGSLISSADDNTGGRTFYRWRANSTFGGTQDIDLIIKWTIPDDLMMAG
jgi:hypothetical protein